MSRMARNQINFIDDLKALLKTGNIIGSIAGNAPMMSSINLSAIPFASGLMGLTSGVPNTDALIDLLIDYDAQKASAMGVPPDLESVLQLFSSFGGIMMFKSMYDCLNACTYSTKKISNMSREKLYLEFDIKNAVGDYETFLAGVKSIPSYGQEPLMWSLLKCFSGTAFGVCFGAYDDQIDILGIPSRTKYIALAFEEHVIPAIGEFLYRTMISMSGNPIPENMATMFKNSAILMSSFASQDVIDSNTQDDVIRYIFEQFIECTVGIAIDRTATNFKDLVKVTVHSNGKSDPVIVIPIDLTNIGHPIINSNFMAVAYAAASGFDNSPWHILADNKVSPDDLNYQDSVFEKARSLDMIFMTAFANFSQYELLYRTFRMGSNISDSEKQAILQYFQDYRCRTVIRVNRSELKHLPDGFIPVAESEYLEDVNSTSYGLNPQFFNNMGWATNMFGDLFSSMRNFSSMFQPR